MEINDGCVRVVIPVSAEMERRLDKMTRVQIDKIEEALVRRFPSLIEEISGYVENLVKDPPRPDAE